jgi:glycosyltransferase involved in cell wall biosynthesis
VHLVALGGKLDHVSTRYRVAAYGPYLERAGHTLELRAWPDKWWPRVRLARDLSHADAVIIQRKLLPRWQLYLLRQSGLPLLYDFDDAVFMHNSYSARGSRSGSRSRRFAALAGMADVLIAGNDWLRAQARQWVPVERIRVIPTCVAAADYPLADHQRVSPGIQLVWIGSSSTLRGLEAIQPLLETLGQRVPGLRLKLICDRFLKLEHLPVIDCPWTEAGEADDIADADIGISWLPDDVWSRGKCGLKVLQYMAAGLPVIANPVGVQADLVQHGQSGFLAETAEEWVEAVGRLANDRELRRRMGQAGRRRVEESFDVGVGADRWLEVLAELRQRKMAS